MNTRYPLETQYLNAHELYDELWQVVALLETEAKVVEGGLPGSKEKSRELTQLRQQINSEFEMLHRAYKEYYDAKRKVAFWEDALSYLPFTSSQFKKERSYLKEALRVFHQQQKINYKGLCEKTGIHLGAGAGLRAFLYNNYEHTAYCLQRSRNSNRQYIKYEAYYRSHVYLHDVWRRFYLTKGNYFYLGLFFFGGVVFTGLAFAAMLGWPPAIWIMLGSNVGVIAMKLILVLGSIPIFYLSNGLIQLKNQQSSKKLGKPDYARGDWHLSHALTLDIIVAVTTVLAIALPLFYIMTVPHGMVLSLWVMAGLTSFSASQAALVYLDGKRRVGYLGSGLLGSVGQNQEALNRKLTLGKIFALSLEHRRHPIKYCLNPFAWLASLVEVVQQLILRSCEIGSQAGARSSLFRFKLKQDINLFIDFMVSPIRLGAVLWDMVLSACDFASAPFIPLWGQDIAIECLKEEVEDNNGSLRACSRVFKNVEKNSAIDDQESRLLEDACFFRWQPVEQVTKAPRVSGFAHFTR